MHVLPPKIALMGLCLLLGACTSGTADDRENTAAESATPADADADAGGDSGADAIAQAPAPAKVADAAEVNNTGADSAGNGPTKPDGVTPEVASSDGDSTGATGGLAAYVGKFPFDKVNGVAWDDHPAVRAAITASVSDRAAREAILNVDGPSAPIKMYQGKVGAWSCQAHNCGDHQWAVLMTPDGKSADVCYHNAESTGDKSRWFLASGKQETRSGNCSVV